ncbi:hypothetical protein [Pseudomarimonas salicorniae]|uniref:DUF4386 family protein n=1 Tax=Pseudomarimonas salicorniae TaxID=2933270 RepID=A0ABT0GKH8_9GAMM|nr:hypothetical protein [Lysobacter sp. CAU 1642]MCK7595030.1 hypothetical protein [Lysobacter sp. CAU 1642]
MGWQRSGALAAIAMALIYLLGFAVLLGVLTPQAGDPSATPAGRLDFMLQHRLAFQLWLLMLYVVFGLLLVVLQIALQQRLSTVSVPRLQWIGALGMIWAGLLIGSGMLASVGLQVVGELHEADPDRALLAWTVIAAVQDGLGGGVEVVGGLWMISLAMLGGRPGGLPRGLAWLAWPVGVCGVLTLIPPLAELGAVFGLGQILWFLLLGVVLWREGDDAPAGAADGAS